ncbi:hypothetical protein AYO21_02933 [Fonsecaea monophora]|uniref:Xylanolytic transcriptional activator regulatory domain-containing protein n=1 Tax=Fonsecaea monophora TaxID=254056 RepID=A0A177FHU4_9EURO|nr:hypothetical protein AYO21_02933 [Fonsecaea monophora]OAG42982.1 hypothetical protein AYO21_02933 [Fonsecaea monophora]
MLLRDENTAVEILARRLDTIENILQRQVTTLEALQSHLIQSLLPETNLGRRHSELAQGNVASQSYESPRRSLSTLSLALQDDPLSRPDLEAIPPLTIPLGHQTGAGSLLALPQLRHLIGDFPEDFFFEVENRRPPPEAMQVIVDTSHVSGDEDQAIPRATVDEYFQKFLDLVHPLHPFLDPRHLTEEYKVAMGKGLGRDNQSAKLLALLALGATASDPVGNQSGPCSGDRLVQRALRILFRSWSLSFRGDIQLCQGLILGSLYFTYSVEPLMAWRLIHMAATNIQQMLIRCNDMSSTDAEIQEITRLSWVCFTIECDIQADFHQPRSGIELLVDSIPFPRYGESPTADNLYSLAEISVRLLQNRIHRAVYFADSLAIYAGRGLDTLATPRLRPGPSNSLFRVCEELDRQLETWYNALPEAIKPDLASDLHDGKNGCLLRLRYWSSKQNIYRPFVLYVTSQMSDRTAAIPPSVLEKCHSCLCACRAYILTAGHLLSHRSPYTYSAAQYCFTCLLVISLAFQSPALRGFVTDVEMLQGRTVEMLRIWGWPGSALECALQIACSIATKQRYCMG